MSATALVVLRDVPQHYCRDMAPKDLEFPFQPSVLHPLAFLALSITGLI